MIATEVMGFVIEAIEKIASAHIGWLLATSRCPTASRYAILPRRAMPTTAPGSMPALMSRSSASLIRASRPVSRPTDWGSTRVKLVWEFRAVMLSLVLS